MAQSYVYPFTDTNATLQTEMWDPVSQLFTEMASAPGPRTYHSIALLLPDARIFNGGGGLCSHIEKLECPCVRPLKRMQVLNTFSRHPGCGEGPYVIEPCIVSVVDSKLCHQGLIRAACTRALFIL